MSRLLSCSKLTSGYDRMPVIRDVDLTVKDGHIVAVLGRNGVGKTTLLQSLLGHIKPTGGIVTFGSQDINDWPAWRIARLGISYVPERASVFRSMSVRQNLQLASRSQREVSLDWFPEQIRSTLHKVSRVRAGLLSGGEQQILGLAIAILRAPRVLVIDELSCGLQPSVVMEVAGLLRRLQRENNTSVLLVEQSLSLVMNLCDDFILLQKGKIVSAGDADRLYAERAHIERLLAV